MEWGDGDLKSKSGPENVNEHMSIGYYYPISESSFPLPLLASSDHVSAEGSRDQSVGSIGKEI